MCGFSQSHLFIKQLCAKVKMADFQVPVASEHISEG